MATQWEVARALALLCQDDAYAITGASIAIDYAVTAGLHTSEITHMTLRALR